MSLAGSREMGTCWKAAGVGFEPTRPLARPSGFQDRLDSEARCGVALSVGQNAGQAAEPRKNLQRSSRALGNQAGPFVVQDD